MMENYFKDIEYNYKKINDNIAEAAIKSGRNPSEVTFLAATKTVEAQYINYAISLGLSHIGENRIQELLSKYDAYNLNNCTLDFIGRLQTNKIKYIVDKVNQVQSVDSIKQIEIIDRQCKRNQKIMNILIEVNIGNEQNKGGVMPENLFEFIDEAREFTGIHINGLMTIPPFFANNDQMCKNFVNMYKYYVDIKGKKLDNISMNCLSMGMSSDYQLAIECGSNMVRIGSSLFGPREYI